MVYRLRIAKEVMRQIDHLPGNIRQRIRRVIAQLPTDPRPLASKQMEGDLSAYHRLRIEEYRIIYTIDDEIIQSNYSGSGSQPRIQETRMSAPVHLLSAFPKSAAVWIAHA